MAFKTFLVLAFFLIGRPQDLIPALQPFRPALVLTCITAAIALMENGTGRITGLFRLREARLYNLLFLVMMAGIPFAYHRKVAFDSVFFSYLSNVIMFYLMLLLVNSVERLKSFMVVILLSLFAYSVFGLFLGTFESGRFYTYGTMFDPNDIAYVLVSLLPVSFFFIFRRSGVLNKAIALTATAASIGLILLTGSRAGLLGLGLIFALLIFSNRKIISSTHKALLVAAMIMVALFYSDRINVERYKTITDISQDYNITDEFGRVQIWKRGFELLLDNPVTGVGVNCFPMGIAMLREDSGLLPRWQATHNSYIQVMAETGFPGLTIFLLLIYVSYSNLRSAGRMKGGTEISDDLRGMAFSMKVGFLGHLFTAFFLTQGYSVLFTMFFASSAAMNNLCARRPEPVKAPLEQRAGLAPAREH